MIAASSNLRLVQPRGPTMLDWATVEESLRNFGSDDSERDRRFLLWAVHELFDVDIDCAEDSVTDGGNDRGIDAIVVDHDERKIHLVSSKVVGNFNHCSRNFPSTEVDKIASFIDDLMARSEAMLSTCNGALAAKVKLIWDIYEHDAYELVVHLCSNQDALVANQRARLVESLRPYNAVLYEHHLVHFAHGVCQETSPRDRASLRFVEGQRIDITKAPIRAVFGSVRLTDLFEFLKHPAKPEIDQSLFRVNVRYHLGAINPVNKEIRQTLHSRDPGKFLHLNNGIVVVCDRLIYQIGAEFPIELVRPQIVNGCQTVNEIFEAVHDNPGKFAEVAVLVRITETSRDDLVRDIALATNSQSRIATRDLKANDQIQLQLEYGLRSHGYYYRRKRGGDPPVASAQIIDARRVGQLLLAYSHERPDRAKTASQAIFSDHYDEVFDPNIVTPSRVVSLHRLFSLVEARKNAALKHLRTIDGPTYAEEWIVEGIYHVLFAVKLICDVDDVNCYDFLEMSARLDDAVEVINSWVRSQNGAASYRLFRSSATNAELRQLVSKRVAKGRKPTAQLSFFD